MREAVVRVGNSALLSVFTGNSLAFSSQFSMDEEVLDKVFKSIYGLSIECLTVITHGVISDKEHETLLTLKKLANIDKYIVIDKQDQKMLENLGKASKCKSLKIISFIDVYKKLFEDAPVIVLDEYFDEEVVVVALSDGEVQDIEIVKTPLVEHCVHSMKTKFGIDKVVNATEGFGGVKWERATNLETLDEEVRKSLGDSVLSLEVSGDTPWIDLTNKVIDMKEKITNKSLKGGDTVKTTESKKREASEVIGESSVFDEPVWDSTHLEEKPKGKKVMSKLQSGLTKKKEPSFIKKKKVENDEELELETPKPSFFKQESDELSETSLKVYKLFAWILAALVVFSVGSFVLDKVVQSSSSADASSDPKRMEYLTSLNDYFEKSTMMAESGQFYYSDVYFNVKSMDVDSIVRNVTFLGGKVQVVVLSRSQSPIDKFQEELSSKYSIVNVEVVEPSAGDKTGSILTKITIK